MKQPATPFAFKKHADAPILADAAPAPRLAPVAAPPKGEGKRGRPREKEEGVREKQVSAYLTPEEYAQLSRKLDGRPASAILRRLILDYIDNPKQPEA
jgi:hypothetical protein